jgi:hypothetical protein
MAQPSSKVKRKPHVGITSPLPGTSRSHLSVTNGVVRCS